MRAIGQKTDYQAAPNRDMRNVSYISAQVAECLEGQRAASHALHDLGATLPHPDLLHDRLQAVLLAGNPERVRAFMRVIQKRLESAR